MTASVCVVGAGPRGTALVEGIVANAPRRRIDVHVVDPYPPGGGHVWQPGQPGHLLMNTVAAGTTLFTDDSVRCAGPIVPGPSLYEWARRIARDGHRDPAVRDEAARTLPWSHPTRRFHGHYLAWVYDRVKATAPEWITIHEHRTRAVALTEDAAGRQTVALEDGSGPLAVDAVILAIGHTDLAPTAEQEAYARFAADHGLFYGPPANPLDASLDAVPPGVPLLVRGLGMNFFDHMSLLTTGRGGRFEHHGERLRYHPSGREPVLYAGSRRGVPYLARGDYGRMPPVVPARYFDDAAVARLRASGPVDFRADVWPLIAKETAAVYYDVLIREEPTACAMPAERFRERFDALPWEDPAMAELIGSAFPDPAVHLDFAALYRPLDGLPLDGEPVHETVRALVRADLAQARDARRSPLKNAMTALGATRGPVRRLVAHGGLTGRSHRRDLDGWFQGFAASVASGPPAGRVDEMLALADAGLLRFAGPDLTVTADPVAGVFLGSSPRTGADPVAAPAFLEAHLPPPDLGRTADPLLRGLRAHGACRPYRIPTPGGPPYQTRGMDVAAGSFRIIDARGREHPRRFALGLPIESVDWLTAMGAKPASNAAMLVQADAVARAALTVR
ncbi:FAD/NAD(P)-binding protein [Actinomadura sp. NTSP31]|uniref:FAD/NAD(P)-binding protein n=1 Tax=Actinomadura sp. NTSP31 TaxID=1735447 RepID=UPI0035BF3F44